MVVGRKNYIAPQNIVQGKRRWNDEETVMIANWIKFINEAYTNFSAMDPGIKKKGQEIKRSVWDMSWAVENGLVSSQRVSGNCNASSESIGVRRESATGDRNDESLIMFMFEGHLHDRLVSGRYIKSHMIWMKFKGYLIKI